MCKLTEHPILFSTPMVQAILADRKTETRRLTKLKWVNNKPNDWIFAGMHPDKELNKLCAVFTSKDLETYITIPVPYGEPGNLIYVRESFKYIDDEKTRVDYKAQYTYPEYHKWKPTIHMPKAAARIWLQNTGITCERLNDITEQSAINEGIESSKVYESMYKSYGQENVWTNVPQDSFFTLISSIHGTETLKQNPWVWVQKFKVLSTTGKPGQKTLSQLQKTASVLVLNLKS